MVFSKKPRVPLPPPEYQPEDEDAKLPMAQVDTLFDETPDAQESSRTPMSMTAEEELRMVEYLRRQLARGVSPEDVVRSLGQQGWDASLLQRLLAAAQRQPTRQVFSEDAREKLHKYIEEKRTQGYSDQQLKEALLASGWNEAVLREEFG